MAAQQTLAVGLQRAIVLSLVLLISLALVPSVSVQTALAATESATVLDFAGSDRLLVQNDAGVTYRVQYIGLRGPTRASVLQGSASAFHGPQVVGQRVRLESDGSDEDEGYKLRHVYPEGGDTPLGAGVIQAGWAVAVPYPVEHRHRELYLRLQEQAMLQQQSLWQPGILGPVAPWRPSGAAEGPYIAADTALHPSLELLTTVAKGQDVVNRMVRIASVLVLRDGLGAAGATEALGNHIELERALLASDPRVMAVVIAHEGIHAIDNTTDAMGLTNISCFESEQRAFAIEADIWAEFFGPNGKSDARDDFERSENEVLRFRNRGDLDLFVQRSAAYERQCAGEALLGGG